MHCRIAQPEAQALGATTRKPEVSQASRHPASLPALGRVLPVQGLSHFCCLPAWHLLSRAAILPEPPVFSEPSLSLAADLPEAKLHGELGLNRASQSLAGPAATRALAVGQGEWGGSSHKQTETGRESRAQAAPGILRFQPFPSQPGAEAP